MKFDCMLGDTGLIYDADGDLLFKPISGDTETGIVEEYVYDEITRQLIVDGVTGDVKRQWVKYKAPLRWDPLPGGWDFRNYKGPIAKGDPVCE